MKGDETAEDLMNGFRAYYNFIRPHMSLDAQIAYTSKVPTYLF